MFGLSAFPPHFAVAELRHRLPGYAARADADAPVDVVRRREYALPLAGGSGLFGGLGVERQPFILFGFPFFFYLFEALLFLLLLLFQIVSTVEFVSGKNQNINKKYTLKCILFEFFRYILIGFVVVISRSFNTSR